MTRITTLRMCLLSFVLLFSYITFQIWNIPLSRTKPVTITIENVPLSAQEQEQTERCSPPPLDVSGPHFHAPSSNRTYEVESAEYLPDCRPGTPLLIAFTSMQCMLDQTILSYLAEGWPSSQILVLDNSGRSSENAAGVLQRDHYASLNYTKLLEHYKVSFYRIPVRLTFAQLQNLYLDIARESNWTDFYWTHQDIVIRSYPTDPPSTPFYFHVLDEQRELMGRDPGKWAFGFYNYDLLSHVNVRVLDKVGYWDDRIPFYKADCDFYRRTRLAGLFIYDYDAGYVFDVEQCLTDLNSLKQPHGTSAYVELTTELALMQANKKSHAKERNKWRGRLVDGPISPDFGYAFWRVSDAGERNYRSKWHTDAC